MTVKFILTVLYKCKHYKHYEMWLVQPSDSVFAKIVQYYIDFIFIEIINYYVFNNISATADVNSWHEVEVWLSSQLVWSDQLMKSAGMKAKHCLKPGSHWVLSRIRSWLLKSRHLDSWHNRSQLLRKQSQPDSVLYKTGTSAVVLFISSVHIFHHWLLSSLLRWHRV